MRKTVHIQNLECCGCIRSITDSLSKIKNISEVEINDRDNTISFNFHTNHDFEKVKHVLSRIGYPIIGSESHLRL